MNLFNDINTVYFLGIGGIGMSALARLFNHQGLRVAGYDRTPSEITRQLLNEGILVHYEDLGSEISSIVSSPGKTLVVYTPAVPAEHKELDWLKQNKFTIVKRARILGILCSQYQCLAVAGTHGKTTVSTMAATIMSGSSKKCGAILGGISKNFHSNLVLPDNDIKWMITEADEFDRSFLQLSPDIAVITSIDADHLDIYSTVDQIIYSFNEFIGKIRPEGTLLINEKISGKVETQEVKTYTYSLNGNSDFKTENLRLDEVNRCYSFQLCTPGGKTAEITMQYPGLINVENAVAAGAAAWLAGTGLHELRVGIESYLGVKRRFDIRYRGRNTIYIDDYAHHPEELKAFITSVRKLFPAQKITGIFQPHLYTRTRDFADEFASSLDLLDTVLILPIYAARENPIEGVSSAILAEKMKNADHHIVEKSAIMKFIKENPTRVLLTMGAGDIDLLSDEIIETIKHEEKA
ncbi:MAG TPA: UDP-N-acetylmuramate--L-alanine ligase [Prolixibacteraceae bacterium]|nr:UDP-N-acetylmuramate--L-alanine ligase [Prolixibacteraceae bacterium]